MGMGDPLLDFLDDIWEMKGGKNENNENRRKNGKGN